MGKDLGNKTIMAKNIKHYMALHRKTRSDICEALGVKYTTLTDWINAKTYPRIDKIEMLANYFGVEKSDLVEQHSAAKKARAIRIPVIGMVHAGYPADAIEDIIDWEEVTPDVAARGDLMALQIKGDCMEPKFSDGDVVIVLCQDAANSGDIVIAMTNGSEAEMRKLKLFENGTINLIPTNPAYPAESYTPKEVESLPVKILGKVIELRAKF